VSLTGKQRRYLRGLGHHLNPVVQLGKAGITEAVIEQTKQALEAHELIKVRFGDGYEDKARPGAIRLAEATDSSVAGVIGHTALLYRPRDEDPDIKLPAPDALPE
jgi:RNA-binding protein